MSCWCAGVAAAGPAGVLHLLGKSYLHYALLPGQAVPDWLGLMQQQPPRHSSSAAAGKAEFALYTFSKHMAYAPKQAINAQVRAGRCNIMVEAAGKGFGG
jgi:hypothetical protein